MALRNRTLLSVGLALSTACLVTACSGGGTGTSTKEDPGKPVNGGSLTVTIPDAIDGWNPDTAVQVSTYQLIREVEAPLLEVSEDGQSVRAGLASAWNYNADGTQLTLDLQPNAAFSDGKPVTAADVVFSVKQWKAGASYGPLYSNFIKSVVAKGDHSVVLTLTAPSSALLGILTWSNSAIFPADFGGKTAKEFFAKPIGAGPFVISEQSGTDQIVLKRNEHYWAAKLPRLDTVTYRVVDDTSQRLLQVQSGDAGLADRVPLDSLSTVDAQSSVVTKPSSSISVITFAEKSGPMADPHFRKAVSLAIDRKALVDSVYDHKAQVAKGVLPAQVPGADGCPTCDWAEHDTAKAKAELAAAKGAGGTIELLVDSSRGIDLLAAQAIQPMLADAGIKVQIKQVDSATLLGRLAGGDFQMAIGNYSAQAPTAVDPLSFLAATGYLFTGADPNLPLGALAAVSSAPDKAKQAAAVAAFEKQNYDAATVVPLVTPDVASVVGSDTHGLTLLPSGLYDAAELWIKK